jgi:hypothetical protein
MKHRVSTHQSRTKTSNVKNTRGSTPTDLSLKKKANITCG